MSEWTKWDGGGKTLPLPMTDDVVLIQCVDADGNFLGNLETTCAKQMAHDPLGVDVGAYIFIGKPTPPSPEPAVNASPLSTQEGGNHYKDLKIQPVEYIHANGIGYFEGNVIKYITRWRAKNGVEDLKKARHYIELLIELEGNK